MELPEPLKPWRSWLDWFSPVLAPEIGRLVRQLSPLLGPVRGTRQAGPVEPEGLSDLRRRGPYERLLGSEWLLAEELPDEFLRRAASGEHLFLAPRPRAKRAAPLIVALFDAGPLQLGAPRLVHLALWILLARRAQEAGGTLRWGVLQTPGRLNEASSLKDLLLLVRSRSFAPATPLEDWQTWLARQAIVPGELWHVGDAPPLGPVSHAVTIRRAIGVDALDVALHQGGGRRSAQLALPLSGFAGERLLKGDFQETTTAPQAHQALLATLTLLRPPVWGPGGRDLVVPVLGEPELHVIHITASRNKPVIPSVLKLPAQVQPLSLAFHGKMVGALIATPSALHFWQMGCPPVPLPPPEIFRITPGRRSWLAGAWIKRGQVQHFYAIDDAQRLVCWRLKDTTKRDRPFGGIVPVASSVFDLARAGTSAVAYVAMESNDAMLVVTQGDNPGRKYRLGPIANPVAAHIAGGIDWSKRFVACAIQSAVEAGASERWVLFHNPTQSAERLADSVTIELPVGYTGIGVIPRADGRGHALLVLAPNRRGLMAFDGTAVQNAVYVSGARIQNLSVDGESGMLALVTEKRELIVYSTRERSVRLVLRGKAGAEDAV